MIQDTDGGPAFPVVGMRQVGNQGVLSVFNGGMTLRDYLAAHAPILNTGAFAQAFHWHTPWDRASDANVSLAANVAAWSYAYADAMIEERTKQRSKP